MQNERIQFSSWKKKKSLNFNIANQHHSEACSSVFYQVCETVGLKT